MKKLVKYPFQKLYKFFLWSSGADLKVLEQVPHEKNKYFGVGGTVIFTALMATFAGGYAIHMTFDSLEVSVFFALFWGALIFNLDRYIVSTLSVGTSGTVLSKQNILEATPRFLIAILLGFVIQLP